MRILRIDEIPSMPWKNGKGSTRLVAEGPGWRISVARVGRDGAFSMFKGTWRHSVVIAGGPVELLREGGPAVLLKRGVATRYPGDVAWTSRLRGPPAAIVNIFTEERVCAAVLQRGQQVRCEADAPSVAVFAVNCEATIAYRNGPIQDVLRPGHVLLRDDPYDSFICSARGLADPSGSYLLGIRIVTIQDPILGGPGASERS
ncbi:MULTISPECIES: HutD family protein [Ramlibacter]|uniref:HutD family protein n=1 Tax=Ramlibacter pinisoli TaxID=2682844 RepID=A0A6N8IVI7_9BURK|nr:MULTISPECIES: HutD family protein [Ramlibacter]MBA2965041.1 HutD family protein [Ramlibacter sp. CGMCC 1.13660]MVQ30006.1 hypothetical protein [Ramlibacter pinisoli]